MNGLASTIVIPVPIPCIVLACFDMFPYPCMAHQRANMHCITVVRVKWHQYFPFRKGVLAPNTLRKLIRHICPSHLYILFRRRNYFPNPYFSLFLLIFTVDENKLVSHIRFFIVFFHICTDFWGKCVAPIKQRNVLLLKKAVVVVVIVIRTREHPNAAQVSVVI